MHVHVGLDEPEKAIYVANGMRVHVPVLVALGANSPFWRGDVTGLASTRTPIFRAFPRVGMPPAFRDWEHYDRTVEFMVTSGVMADYTYLWYDVRPHPNFGTVEIRCCDSQTRVEHTLGLVALIQAMVKELAEYFDGRARAQRLPVADARREQVAGRTPRPRRRARRPAAPASASRRATSSSGCSSACARTPRSSDRRPSSRPSMTCWSAATGRRASRSSTRPTTTCTRSWSRSSRRPLPEQRCQRPPHSGGCDNREPMAPGPELFVVCKSCGSEVSPYITECPYCGARLRKRAPKIERDRPVKPSRRIGAPDARAAAPGRDPRHPRRPDAPAVRDARRSWCCRCSGCWPPSSP